MKPIKLSNTNLDLIDLSRFDKYLMPKYKISHNNGGYGFYENSGTEHYKLLAYLSMASAISISFLLIPPQSCVASVTSTRL